MKHIRIYETQSYEHVAEEFSEEIIRQLRVSLFLGCHMLDDEVGEVLIPIMECARKWG